MLDRIERDTAKQAPKVRKIVGCHGRTGVVFGMFLQVKSRNGLFPMFENSRPGPMTSSPGWVKVLMPPVLATHFMPDTMTGWIVAGGGTLTDHRRPPKCSPMH